MGETTSVVEALRDLQLKQSELSKAFKSLKRSRLRNAQLVVVGMQSSGKSSVLDRISRVRLPTDSKRFVK
ncbi:hypothetical protein Asppvi_003618 [Aspergillus pseudoviridinutans]|uniref:Dynamin-type G domain-containing protein n=1 Tax=Aspergillus pseudoviridinutans TaxID=1517512 RepID=A0A9P3B545_9EURO|nr:uncharacterized protein Asppvi_003618 [Aspergillus pseudoviridinutans]GIJ84767.1 hypothetical protein Asppvi_003618 [Aspergillus pseudoviridinutans]